MVSVSGLVVNLVGMIATGKNHHHGDELQASSLNSTRVSFGLKVTEHNHGHAHGHGKGNISKLERIVRASDLQDMITITDIFMTLVVSNRVY
jgi:hypothetical protein